MIVVALENADKTFIPQHLIMWIFCVYNFINTICKKKNTVTMFEVYGAFFEGGFGD